MLKLGQEKIQYMLTVKDLRQEELDSKDRQLKSSMPELFFSLSPLTHDAVLRHCCPAARIVSLRVQPSTSAPWASS